MKWKLRILLPCLIGTISFLLVLWDVHNQAVIASMGMRWDTGAPLWPYQTPAIVLYFLNYPTHCIVQPMANHLDLTTPKHYLLIFPATLLWWWFFGLEVDHSLVWNRRGQEWLLFAILIAVGAVLLWGATISFGDAIRWWFQYGQGLWTSQILILLEKLAPAVWGFAVSSMVAVAAKRAALG